MISKDGTNLIVLRRMNRRTFLKMAGAGAGAVALGGTMRYAFGLVPPETGCGIQEFQPYVTSPFITNPFTDSLPIPTAMAPGWRRVDGTLIPPVNPTIPEADGISWTVRRSKFLAGAANPTGAGIVVPGPAENQQDVYGHLMPGDPVVNGVGDAQTVAVEHRGTHEVWPNATGTNSDRLVGPVHGPFSDPILYHIRYQLGTHSFSNSPVRVLVDFRDPAGKLIRAGTVVPKLPDSVIYGFNGTFPGPMVNLEYGKPVIIRFENDLDINPPAASPGTPALDRQDFGAPDFAVLTHQHNGHTAPESDGQPHYMQINDGGYTPGDWIDSLYINYPAGGDPTEIQSFLWFHDHRMHFTGANVYKGQVGLTPYYDPGIPADAGGIVPGTGLDTGNEADPAPNLKLPGVRVNHPDGTFDVKYDIPLVFYDCALDDGVTPHADLHVDLAVCGAAHPEWWGKTFFRHWPNHGFVGDVFTVNATAYPVLHVFQRRYRFRFLDASVSRIYELALMTSAAGPVEKPGTQGQWQIPDGVQWKQWTWIASMGGLLPKAALSDTFHIWPASRREFVVDFTDAKPGDVIYITNVAFMQDGREPVFNKIISAAELNNQPYKVPMVKIIVDGPPPEPDQSAVIVDGTPLRPMPKLADGSAPTLATTAALPHTTFTLTRGGPTTESQWVINGLPFDALTPLHTVFRGKPEVWTNKNGGGGWVHPMHMHMEENTVLERVGSTLPIHVEDTGKEDVTNLEPSESVTFYRNFRTFTGRYVAHCHNLAHEDHNMMFGWTILEPPAGVTHALSGTVADGAGVGIPGVLMTLTNAAGAVVSTTPTDGAGSYRIAGLADGSYTITPTKAGFTFAPASAGVTIAGVNVTVPNFVGAPAAGAAIFAISGQVTNKVGTPLRNVPMTLSGAANATINTDAFGHYTFGGLANGNYTVTPNAANTLKGFTFVPTSLAVTVNGANVDGKNFTTKQKKVT